MSSLAAADGLLARVVDADGRIDYEALVGDPRLGETILKIAEQELGDLTTHAQRLAFWINAYNVSSLSIVGRWAKTRKRLPRRGLRGWWTRFRFFFLERVRVARRTRTLYTMEYRDLGRLTRDPRVHCALVCATASCPPLKAGLYDADRLEGDLDAAARAFMRPGVGYRIDRASGRIHANRIFRWYRRDFAAVAGVRGAILRWGPEEDARVVRKESLEVTFDPYDWSLNAAEVAEDAIVAA